MKKKIITLIGCLLTVALALSFAFCSQPLFGAAREPKLPEKEEAPEEIFPEAPEESLEAPEETLEVPAVPKRSITVCGESVLPSAWSVDLSHLNLTAPGELADLAQLPAGMSVKLLGKPMTFAQTEAISEAFPELKFSFRYSAKELGLGEEERFINSAVKELDLSGYQGIRLDLLEELLAHMPNLQKLVMCDCGFSDEEMAVLRDAHPEMEVVWRVYMGGGAYSLRTDGLVFSAMAGEGDLKPTLISEDVQVLRYCRDLRALDLGHMQLEDISFLSDLPELRLLILADCPFTDMTEIGKLSHLTYLEVFLNFSVNTLEPLSHLSDLRDLNISYMPHANDYEYLYGLKNLERLWANHCELTYEARQGLMENIVPTCEIHAMEDESSTGGWRDDNPKYLALVEMFDTGRYNAIFD